MNRNKRTFALPTRAAAHLAVIASAAFAVGANAIAQVPVDDYGNPLSDTASPLDGVDIENPTVNTVDDLTAVELETLVGPIALYPDDLLAVVLPASTYPLEIVQAARYLERVQADSTLEPDEAWDDSIVALLNYPDVLNMMNDDLDWTWQLGDAVVSQQTDVIQAIESFRDRAYAAGNLQSDDRQTVSRTNEGVIEIAPVQDDVIYVPYYEPERVVYYSPTPVYHYYPRAYPVYYYPYPYDHYFTSSLFWGVTTAFTIGWATEHLHVYHHSYYGHPYYGHRYNYYGSYWRRPSINVYNTWYVDRRGPHYKHRYQRGDYWRPRHHRSGARPSTRVVHTSYNGDNRQRETNRRSTSDYRFRERANRSEFENRVRRTGIDGPERRRAERNNRRDNTITAGRQDQVRGRSAGRSSGGSEDIRFRSRANDGNDRVNRSGKISNAAADRRRSASQSRVPANTARVAAVETRNRSAVPARRAARVEAAPRSSRDLNRGTARRNDYRAAPRRSEANRAPVRASSQSRPVQKRSAAPRPQSARPAIKRPSPARSANRSKAPRNVSRAGGSRGSSGARGRTRQRN